MTLVFYLAAVIAIVTTLLVVVARHAIHALLALVASLLSVALMMFALGATLAAALEVIIYAGAVMVLFVFAVMMVKSPSGEGLAVGDKLWHLLGPTALGLLFFDIVLASIQGLVASGAISVSPATVAVALFGRYLPQVETASLLLVAGLLGAHHLGRRGL